VCDDKSVEKKFPYKTFFGETCVKDFLESLISDVQEIAQNYLLVDKEIEFISDEDREKIKKSTKECCICFEDFKERDIRVFHHDHFDGKLLGLSHRSCNTLLRKPRFVNLIYHNINYDLPLIMRELVRIDGPINVLAINKERYIAVFKTIFLKDGRRFQIRICDSFRFLPGSLDSLVRTLKTDDLINFRGQVIQDYGSTENFELLSNKGYFPYSYIDNYDKFNQTEIPKREDFFSDLTNETISQENYNHACKVWSTFNIKNLREYMELYLKCDVLLLADIFDNFRKVCYSKYGLDPLWYVTLGSLSWSCFLKYTKCEIELISDEDQISMLHMNIRGGLSQVGKKYCVANNPYLKEGYNPNEDTSYLVYLDQNNNYGLALMQSLPIGNFKWVKEPICQKEWNKKKICSIPDDSPIGYIFDVDLIYNKELHDYHNDLPFAMENIRPPNGNSLATKKLIPNLGNKDNKDLSLSIAQAMS
jgi:hypothetical protein